MTLAPSAVALARDLHQQFGESVRLTVGRLPYPPGRDPDIPLPATPLRGEEFGLREAEIRLDGPAIARSGETLHHGLLVRNLGGEVLRIATNGQVTAVVVDPRTGRIVGGFAGPQIVPLIMFDVAPRATARIPFLIGTASYAPELGYTVPPGEWGVQAPVKLGSDQGTHRLTPVLPLTVTAPGSPAGSFD